MAKNDITLNEDFSWKQFLTQKRYVPKWLKWGVTTIVVLLIVGWLIWSYFFKMQVTTLALLRMNKEDLSIVPQPLSDRTIGPSYGPFDAFGYSFQLPWKDAKRLNNFIHDFATRSPTGDMIVFRDPDTGAPDMATLIKKGPEEFRSIFTSGKDTSAYALLREELFTRPEDISFFVSRRRAFKTCMFARLKWVELTTGVKEIEDIDTPYVHGFEYKKDNGVILKLFDASDNLLDIQFANSKVPIPQSEINAFIFSLRPVSEESHESR